MCVCVCVDFFSPKCMWFWSCLASYSTKIQRYITTTKHNSLPKRSFGVSSSFGCCVLGGYDRYENPRSRCHYCLVNAEVFGGEKNNKAKQKKRHSWWQCRNSSTQTCIQPHLMAACGKVKPCVCRPCRNVCRLTRAHTAIYPRTAAGALGFQLWNPAHPS